jgi:uncharacterized protein with von Willebrand factor type A (vWA) domain
VSRDAAPHRPLLANLLHFGRGLRRAGLEVHPGRMMDALDALQHVDLGRRSDVRTALATLLVHRHEDLVTFHAVFDLFWRARPAGARGIAPRSIADGARVRGRLGSAVEISFGTGDRVDTPDGARPARTLALGAYSRERALRARDFALFTADEMAEAAAVVRTLRWSPGLRRTRRWTTGRGRALDWRALVRRNIRFGGELVDLPRRRRRLKPRPLVLVCDVSGSMERYTRLLLHFAHTIAHAHPRRRVELFVFATGLTRVTPCLGDEGIDRTLARIGHAVPDWAGGTRIGEALDRFNREWARRVLRHQAIVLLISDGWDRGEPARLARAVARLQRSCWRLIWLNPLLGSADYEPLTRGMRAALPFVDDFMPAHNLDSLAALARHLDSLSQRRDRPTGRDTPQRN